MVQPGMCHCEGIYLEYIRYVPKPDEWIHEFSWHGTDPNNKTAKVKDMLKFRQKIR